MRSDQIAGAGGSAVAGFAAARAAARRRRGVQAGAGVAGGCWSIAAPSARSALVGAAVALVVMVAARPQPDPARWLRGAAGERSTARVLAALPSRRWVVLHDRAVPGSRANLDHVVIGPSGVWLVDTKTFRAPLRAGWLGVRAGHRRLDTEPTAWEASVLADRLGVEVQPVVAVHGRGLRRRGVRRRGVVVVPAEGLLRRLRRRPWRGSRLGRDAVAEVGARCDELFPPATARRAR